MGIVARAEVTRNPAALAGKCFFLSSESVALTIDGKGEGVAKEVVTTKRKSFFAQIFVSPQDKKIDSPFPHCVF